MQPSNSTQVIVAFGRYRQPTGATFAAAGVDWSGVAASTVFKWRVRKSSAGAAVGFGIVQPGTSAGLVSAAGLPGNTTGNAIATGYVGELQFNGTHTAVTATSGAYSTIVSVTLTTGIWDVSGATYFINAAGTSTTAVSAAISTGSTPDTFNGLAVTFISGITMGGSQTNILPTPVRRIVVTGASQTINLLGRCDFTSTAPTYSSNSSYIRAARIA